MDHDHAPLFIFLFLMAVFVGILYFVSDKLWAQDESFSRMASIVDSMLQKLSH